MTSSQLGVYCIMYIYSIDLNDSSSKINKSYFRGYKMRKFTNTHFF